MMSEMLDIKVEMCKQLYTQVWSSEEGSGLGVIVVIGKHKGDESPAHSSIKWRPKNQEGINDTTKSRKMESENWWCPHGTVSRRLCYESRGGESP